MWSGWSGRRDSVVDETEQSLTDFKDDDEDDAERKKDDIGEDEAIAEEIENFAKFERTKTTIKLLKEMSKVPNRAKILLGAKFLHRELPVRIARRVIDLRSLPYGLSNMPTVKQEAQDYLFTFKQLRFSREPLTLELDAEFTQLLKQILFRHLYSVQRIAQGVVDLKKQYYLSGKNKSDAVVSQIPPDQWNFQESLDKFHRSRISIYVLIEHHIANHYPRPGWIGVVEEQCKPAEVIQSIAQVVQTEIENKFQVRAPPVRIAGHANAKFPYIRDHLEHMIKELLANSMRATVLFHTKTKQPGMQMLQQLPEIRVVISEGNEDVSIKIEDQGGGIPQSILRNIFSYNATAEESLNSNTNTTTNSNSSNNYNTNDDLKSGMGYGLPICKCYAEYFGGELKIFSLEGFGTDAFLHLPHVDRGRSLRN